MCVLVCVSFTTFLTGKITRFVCVCEQTLYTRTRFGRGKNSIEYAFLARLFFNLFSLRTYYIIFAMFLLCRRFLYNIDVCVCWFLRAVSLSVPNIVYNERILCDEQKKNSTANFQQKSKSKLCKRKIPANPPNLSNSDR